jgi:hypothetical protein
MERACSTNEIDNKYNISDKITEEKRPLGRSKFILHDNIIMNLKNAGGLD